MTNYLQSSLITSILSQKIVAKKEIYISQDFNSSYSGDARTVASFGEEWEAFSHDDLDDTETAAKEYFDIFKLEQFKEDWIAVDVGCGTGRWARRVAPKVKLLFGVDPSDAINVFKKNTKLNSNIIPVRAYAENLPFLTESVDVALSLGVLHHIKDTDKGINEINRILKNKGFFLFYFYYSLDGRSSIYRFLFQLTNYLRKIVCRLPTPYKNFTCDLLAIFIYLPLIIFARFFTRLFGEKIGSKLPLAGYRNKNYYIIRNDSRDRFGTPLEKRFSKVEIETMLKKNGFTSIHFSNGYPYWHGYAIK